MPRQDDSPVLEGKNATPMSMSAKYVSKEEDEELGGKLEAYYSVLDEPEMLEVFLNLPEITEDDYHHPTDYQWIAQEQQNDEDLQEKMGFFPVW